SPEPDFERQVQRAFDNLAAVLEAAGCGFDDIVDVTTFHTDPASQWEAVSAVRLKAFAQPPYPNWTAVGVNWLAGFDFEITVVARLPEAARGAGAAPLRRRVVEDHPQRHPVPAPHRAHPMPELRARDAPRALDRPLGDREDHRLALAQRRHAADRLAAR